MMMEVRGSLTFKMAVEARDWEAVKRLAPQQRDEKHGTPLLTDEDWEYIRQEAAKDGQEV